MSLKLKHGAAAIWPRMEDEEGNCLTANNAEEATWEACVDDTLLSSQGWRLIAFTADQGIDALESLQFPGSCAVLGADLEVSLCSCSQVALSVSCSFCDVHGFPPDWK